MELPVRNEPPDSWEHYDLWQEVKGALYALPAHFKSETVITGIRATDLFALNSAVSTAIEDQVVETLNAMRNVWDPEDKYTAYGFYRQPQTFPDVILKKHSPDGDDDVILGIELKGWYILSKEAEPSLRFQVTKSACAPADLICIVPWSLSNVISGAPRAYTPWVESAQYAADYRTYYWQELRDTEADTAITMPSAQPYPSKADQISDQPAVDGGGNFGRISRSGMMADFLDSTLDQMLAGIKSRHWLAFLKMFKENSNDEDIEKKLASLEKKLAELEKKTGAR